MQNITIEKLRADAARLGYHQRPQDDLIKLIETSVKDKFQILETKYKTKKEKTISKLDLLNKKRKEIKNKVGETLIDSQTMLQGVSGVFLLSILFYIGFIENILTGFLYIGLGICGAIMVHIKPENSAFWKPLFFSALSLLIVIMQTTLLYDRGFSYGLSIIFSIPLGIIIYILNENLFASGFSFMNQFTAVWHRLHLAVNRLRSALNQRMIIKIEKKYEATINEKDRSIQKYVKIINHEYDIASLASSIRETELVNINHYQLNGEEHKYAN